jgi:hypothetical protein
MKILLRFLKNHQNLDFTTKFYLYLDYKNNLKQIKNKYALSYTNMILYPKINFQSKVKKSKFEDKNLNLNTFVNLEKELKDIKKEIQRKRIEKAKEFLFKILKIIDVRHLIDLKNSKDNIQKLFGILSKQIEIYKKSIQELVEGQREVTQNKNFTFEDGDTVQEKVDRFESKIKEYLNIQGHIEKYKKL